MGDQIERLRFAAHLAKTRDPDEKMMTAFAVDFLKAADDIERLTTENGELDACCTDQRLEIERLSLEHGEMNEANVRYEKQIESLQYANDFCGKTIERLTARIKVLEDVLAAVLAFRD